MAVWLVRAGSRGQRQDFALDNGVAIIGWDEMPDLAKFKDREGLEASCKSVYPDSKPAKITNWVGQLWAFARRIVENDIIALPLKGQNSIALGRVTGPYTYSPDKPNGAKHARAVQWIIPDVPRDRFDKDLLFSLGSAMTVCQIKRNNAEERIRAMLDGKPNLMNPIINDSKESEEITDTFAPPDLAEYADTQIRTHIDQNFKGHRLADLVNAVLQAQGFQTQLSDPGPDGGVDIIAGRGPMGFDPPRLCVQVKSADGQQDVKVLRELKGVMKDFGADQGLFVAWGGFKRTVVADARRAFFEIRLWDAGDLVQAVLKYYDQFSEDIKAELPLKRIWTLVQDIEA